MKLSKQRAEKYVRYRNRYLFGSGAVYSPSSAALMCGGEDAVLSTNSYPSFLFGVGKETKVFGSYLNADFLGINVVNGDHSSEEFEYSPVGECNYGDSIIYSSYAALNFACEFVILRDIESIELCRNILAAMQRLGDYQKGYNESIASGEHSGFMLRADSVNAALEENICKWIAHSDDAKDLEPSYDQYCALLSNLKFILKFLDQITPTQDEVDTVEQVKRSARERISRVVLYLSRSFWTILYVNPEGKFRIGSQHRGGQYCLQAAYPFSRIAFSELGNSLPYYFGDKFPVAKIPNFPGTEALDLLLERIKAEIPNQIESVVKSVLREIMIDVVRNKVIGGALEEVVQLFEGSVNDAIAAVLDTIAEYVSKIVGLIKKLSDAVLQFTATALSSAVAIPLSIVIHRYYSKYMLEDIKDSFLVPLGDWLALVGIVPPSSIDFEFNFEIAFATPDPPSWWPRNPLNNEPIGWVSWRREFKKPVRESIDISVIWKIPVPLNILDILGVLITGSTGVIQKKEDLQCLAFISNAAADTFFENFINPIDCSERLNNSLMMSLTYRCYPALFSDGNARNGPRFDRVMSLIDSAPEGFPNGSTESGPWNCNFRWMRGTNGSANKLYPGMDYMLPLMLACSNPEDVRNNQVILREAMAPKFKEESDMGVFRLPFQGPCLTETAVFKPDLGGDHSDTLLYVGVAWEKGRGQGVVTLKWKDKAGVSQSDTFKESEPGKMVAMPLTLDPVTVLIQGSSRGAFLVQTSK